MTRTASSIDRALDWLISAQMTTGELPSYSRPLGDGSEGEDWTLDSLLFITALAAAACNEVDDPRATAVVDRAVDFLRSEREPASLWRYWSSGHERHDDTPPDVDDTACCSMAVRCRGDATDDNVKILLANRDPAGRFYTWIIPHGQSAGPRHLWVVRREFSRSTRLRRALLWRDSEATPDDVDAVVNANVIRYLGPDHAPREAVDWVLDIVRSGKEATSDSWHRNSTTMYASVADGFRAGIAEFGQLGPVVVERITNWISSVASPAPLDVAQALLAVQGFDGPAALQHRLAERLLGSQRADGSWVRSVFYYGGPAEVFGWGSESLSTATALRALAASERRGA